jgi:ribA/ribD-fused uncharacterized protein
MNFYSIAPFIREFYPQYYSIETYLVADCVAIRKVKEPWGIFGNFAPTPIIINHVSFKTSEQLFQLMKFKDAEPVLAVYQANNPKMTAKHWEKTHRREDWGQMIVDVMKFCLGLKYEQNKVFRQELERSIGKCIVEDQTSFPKKTPDTWGVKQQGDNFVGPNLLGRLLMELRDNGKLDHVLPADAMKFIEYLK